MSEYRQLHRSFWESGYVEEDLDAEGAWIYCYLIAGPLSNMEGLYKCRKARICRQTHLTMEIVDKWLRRFESDGYAGWLKGWVCVTQATDFMPLSPQMKIHAKKLYADVPEDILVWAGSIGYRFPDGLDTVYIRYQTRLDNTRHDETDTDTVFKPVKKAVGLASSGDASHGKT